MRFSDKATLSIAEAVQAVIEGLQDADLDESRMSEFHAMMKDGKSAAEIAKALKLDVKTVKTLMSEDTQPTELEAVTEAKVKKLSSKEEAAVLKLISKTKTTKEAAAKVAQEMKISDKEASAVVKMVMSQYESVEVPVEAVSEESIEEAKNDKQAKYQAFFKKAMKKFGIDDITDLKGDKKKEFFDYVDANYEAEGEVDEVAEPEAEGEKKFKALHGVKVSEETTEVDEAAKENWIDGVKYQKEKKKKGFNKADWEWNSSKQLYKKVNEDVLESIREALAIDESMEDTLKRLKKMGGSVYGDKLTSKSDKTPAKLASQSRGKSKKTVYFVVTDDGHKEYKDLGAVKKDWTIAGNTADTKIALDLMSKQGDGDAIDMVLNKYKISIDKLDKIVKDNLGAKSAADFLGEAVELDEAFLRLPGEMINGELPMAIRDLESILKGLKAGNDFDAKGFNKQMARLTAVKKAAKKFNSEKEVPTRYQYTKKESVESVGEELLEAMIASVELLEAKPSTVIVVKFPIELFNKAGQTFRATAPEKHKTTVVAASNDRYFAIAGEPKALEKMLKTDPLLKGKVDVDAVMATAVKFTGKETFGRQKGANFKN